MRRRRPRAREPPARFGADDPAAQLAPLTARQTHRKGVVGGFEQVVPLVEHIAGRHRRVVEPAECGLGHDERMIGDDDPRAAGLADVLLDKAAAKMWAGGVHAFAAAVGERADPRAPDQLGEPAGEVAADQVARLARGDPARHQPELRRGPPRPGHRTRSSLLIVQQAQEILPSLADDDAAALGVRVGVETVELAGDLGLQVAGKGRDPHRAAVLLGPQARRRDIAERLADPGAGFGQHRVRPVGKVARGKGGGDGGRIIGLLRARLGIDAEQAGEPGARLRRCHRVVAGRRSGRGFGPFGEPAPYPQSRHMASGAGFGRGQGGQHRRRPQPAAAIHRLGDAAAFGVVLLPERLEQGPGRGRQGDAGLGRAARRRQPESVGEAARGRHAKPRRIDKGEQLQEVECREPRRIEPPRGGARMAQQRRIDFDPAARFGRRQHLDIAVRAQPQDFAKAGDQNRGLRRQHLARPGRKVALAVGHGRQV